MDRLQDVDPLETREWVEALDAVLEIEGPDRAHFLLEQLVDKARRSGAYLPYTATVPRGPLGSVAAAGQRARAVPYFQWDNRDGQPMRVWLPAIMA